MLNACKSAVHICLMVLVCKQLLVYDHELNSITGLYSKHMFCFRETSKLFFRVFLPFYIITSNMWVMQFLQVLSCTWSCHQSFQKCHTSPMANYVECLFHGFNCHLDIVFGEMLLPILGQFRLDWWLIFKQSYTLDSNPL